MDGMYIQYNQVESGVVSYFDYQIINIDLHSEQCTFYSRLGEALHQSKISHIKDNKVFCDNAKIELHKFDLNTLNLYFTDGLNKDKISYLKISKIDKISNEINNKFSDKIQKINEYLFFIHESTLGVKRLFPVHAIDEENIEYYNLLNFEIEKYSGLNVH